MSDQQLEFEIRFFEKLVQDKPDFVDAMIPLAAAYTRKGCLDRGLDMDRRLSRLLQNDPVVYYNLACSLALTGNPDDAMDALRRAVDLGYDDFEYLLKDSDLKSLRDHPQFQELLERKNKTRQT